MVYIFDHLAYRVWSFLYVIGDNDSLSSYFLTPVAVSAHPTNLYPFLSYLFWLSVTVSSGPKSCCDIVPEASLAFLSNVNLYWLPPHLAYKSIVAPGAYPSNLTG